MKKFPLQFSMQTMKCSPKLRPALSLGLAMTMLGIAWNTTAQAEPFDIAAFALPRTPANEVRFEEPRDVQSVEVEFTGKAPDGVSIAYLQNHWPENRIENYNPDHAFSFGWTKIDDSFNTKWKPAEVEVSAKSTERLQFTFRPLTTEFPKTTDYDVTFRRTLGIQVTGADEGQVKAIHVYTVSKPAVTDLRVELDAGTRVKGAGISLSAYNAMIESVTAGEGAAVDGNRVVLHDASPRSFTLRVSHMLPEHDLSGDEGLITFALEDDTFTISLTSLMNQGPIWSEDFGVYVTRAEDETPFDAYRERTAGDKTIAESVLEEPEQTYQGAFGGQPRPHTISFPLGCALARERFLVEANGDLLVRPNDLNDVKGKDTERYKAHGNGHFYFGLEKWEITSRAPSADFAPVFSIEARKGELKIHQESLAVPLLVPADSEKWAGDDPIVAMVKFRLENTGTASITAELPVAYAQHGERANSYYARSGNQDDYGVTRSPLDELALDNGALRGPFDSEVVLRGKVVTDMQAEPDPVKKAVVYTKSLEPGQSCELLLKVPFIALENDEELAALDRLEFSAWKESTLRYWRIATSRAATLSAPDWPLQALHAAHFMHIQTADISMPDEPRLINTSVGTSTYGNFSNESCMIIRELDERGENEQAQRRLDLWVKYQGSVPQAGNFTDFDGMFYGAGGYEVGQYNQHHGWVIWAMSEHYLITRNDAWFRSIAEPLIKGADWVFRQRRNTMKELDHSRGWEYGFLPAGSLEDVQDFHYWQATNTLTWRGVDNVARALEAFGHPEAARVRKEADAYKADVMKGLETARQHAPLVRLRDGRWVPYYPSRLYNRGRELGWIRETLEGSVYLLLSGMYDPNGREAKWILDDYQDNRLSGPPYGYPRIAFNRTWFSNAGFSMQPCLLANLLPYLDRDEPELYLWVFFNAWNSVYLSESNAMVEHPSPWLGWANNVLVKTSDEANAISWLRYMFVYSKPKLLHLGRAIPRNWFGQTEPFETQRVATEHGRVGIRYEPNPVSRTVRAVASLELRDTPEQLFVRFRTPDKTPLKSVTVNGQAWSKFGAEKGDVDLAGLSGNVVIEIAY
ncbi:MAG: hypothetical protein K1Y02_01170 [Candidatus Hydrogenedentes bacterium]|nr:hypothetical protein [Candidatus Hydrogenedentota bacterium]